MRHLGRPAHLAHAYYTTKGHASARAGPEGEGRARDPVFKYNFVDVDT